MIQLDAIAFNHDPDAATRDALNVRVNATRGMPIPEWQRGISLTAEDSIVVYALNDTLGNTLTVRASFSRLATAVDRAEIRASAVSLQPGSSWLPVMLWLIARFYPHYYAFYYPYLWSLAVLEGVTEDRSNALGDVAPRQVVFGPDGRVELELFELENTDIWSRGVGNDLVEWQWQFRLTPSQPWTDFARTQHRVFTILETPKAPWQQSPFVAANTQLLWTDVLQHACRWASGATSFHEIADRITRRVNALGNSVFEYGCPIGGLTQYTGVFVPFFNCTAFLNRIAGGPGNGPFINCSDCAAAVSTFSNALGCNLFQSRMGTGVTFQLNPILAIGSSIWRPACGWPGFDMHEVAWAFPCGEDDVVFDASLHVDGDLAPTHAPHTALLPVHARFGHPGDGGYLDRLTTPTGRLFCRPQPITRQRRPVV